MITLLIDGDEWAYKAALAGEQLYYLAWDTLKDKEVFRGTRRKEVIEGIGNNDYDLRDIKEDLGIQKVNEKLSIWLEEIYECVFTHFKISKEEVELKVFLSGSFKDSFRNNIATILPYKGNRDPDKRPKYLAYAKDILTKEYGATAVSYLEADDLLSINQKEDTVIVTQDKDLNMVPGYRLFTTKMTIERLEEPMCTLFFYCQILTGDPTDNIPGLSSVGEKTALKLLSKSNTEEELYNKVCSIYKDRVKNGKHLAVRGPKKGEPLWETDKSAEDIVWEIANLLWMRRSDKSKEDFWVPPNVKEE